MANVLGPVLWQMVPGYRDSRRTNNTSTSQARVLNPTKSGGEGVVAITPTHRYDLATTADHTTPMAVVAFWFSLVGAGIREPCDSDEVTEYTVPDGRSGTAQLGRRDPRSASCPRCGVGKRKETATGCDNGTRWIELQTMRCGLGSRFVGCGVLLQELQPWEERGGGKGTRCPEHTPGRFAESNSPIEPVLLSMAIQRWLP